MPSDNTCFGSNSLSRISILRAATNENCPHCSRTIKLPENRGWSRIPANAWCDGNYIHVCDDCIQPRYRYLRAFDIFWDGRIANISYVPIYGDRQNTLYGEWQYYPRELVERFCYRAPPNQRYGDLWFVSGRAYLDYCASYDDVVSDDDYEDDERSPILGYSTDVIDICGWPSGLSKRALCFGVELEMEAINGYENQRKMARLLGGPSTDRYILKSDGSLNYGAELVTVPGTLAWHQATDATGMRWAEVLKKVEGIAKSGKGTRSCGIHVHVNRKALTALMIGKILVFINDDNNKEFVEMIAQRGNNTYCQKSKKKLSDGRRVSENRYEAVNVMHKTIEFRIFRGNLRPERVIKNVEFCHALINFSKVADPAKLGYTDFLAWLSKHESAYPNLVKFIKEKSALPPSRYNDESEEF